ncbi:hypothetical protein KAU11_01430 [Candidatus Babeliales bacterium]|nr:hypothetical protein [Candidatus Babeliales bacterium]
MKKSFLLITALFTSSIASPLKFDSTTLQLGCSGLAALTLGLTGINNAHKISRKTNLTPQTVKIFSKILLITGGILSGSAVYKAFDNDEDIDQQKPNFPQLNTEKPNQPGKKTEKQKPLSLTEQLHEKQKQLAISYSKDEDEDEDEEYNRSLEEEQIKLSKEIEQIKEEQKKHIRTLNKKLKKICTEVIHGCDEKVLLNVNDTPYQFENDPIYYLAKDLIEYNLINPKEFETLSLKISKSLLKTVSDRLKSVFSDPQYQKNLSNPKRNDLIYEKSLLLKNMFDKAKAPSYSCKFDRTGIERIVSHIGYAIVSGAKKSVVDAINDLNIAEVTPVKLADYYTEKMKNLDTYNAHKHQDIQRKVLEKIQANPQAPELKHFLKNTDTEQIMTFFGITEANFSKKLD